MTNDRNRLIFRLFRLSEGEAEGRFAIAAFVLLVLAILAASILLKSLLA